MHVNHCGINFTHYNFRINRPAGSHDYLFVYTKTPACFTLHGEDVYTLPNAVFLYEKDSPQFFRGSEEIYINDYIHFDTDGDEDERFIRSLGLNFNIPIFLPDVQSFMKVQQMIVYETQSASSHTSDATDALLKYFLIKLADAVSLSKEDHNIKKYISSLQWLRHKIYEEPQLPWTLEMMSDFVNFSESHLQKKYKQVFNVACMTDVILAIIEKAKNLLILTDYTAREISCLCGYQNETHFSRQFKKITKYSPLKYRRKYL